MSEYRSDLVDVTVELKYSTAKAILVSDGGKEEVWLPKSQIEYVPIGQPHHIIVTLPEKLAKEKGLI